jgi:hypothetical protein
MTKENNSNYVDPLQFFPYNYREPIRLFNVPTRNRFGEFDEDGIILFIKTYKVCESDALADPDNIPLFEPIIGLPLYYHIFDPRLNVTDYLCLLNQYLPVGHFKDKGWLAISVYDSEICLLSVESIHSGLNFEGYRCAIDGNAFIRAGFYFSGICLTFEKNYQDNSNEYAKQLYDYILLHIEHIIKMAAGHDQSLSREEWDKIVDGDEYKEFWKFCADISSKNLEKRYLEKNTTKLSSTDTLTSKETHTERQDTLKNPSPTQQIVARTITAEEFVTQYAQMYSLAVDLEIKNGGDLEYWAGQCSVGELLACKFLVQKRDIPLKIHYNYEDELLRFIQYYNVDNRFSLFSCLVFSLTPSGGSIEDAESIHKGYIPIGHLTTLYEKYQLFINTNTGEIELYPPQDPHYTDRYVLKNGIKCAKDGSSFLRALLAFTPTYLEAEYSRNWLRSSTFSEKEHILLQSNMEEVLAMAGGAVYSKFWSAFIMNLEILVV